MDLNWERPGRWRVGEVHLAMVQVINDEAWNKEVKKGPI